MLSVQVTGAQAPAGSDRLAAGAVAESIRVMRELDTAVIHGRRDAATWFHRGMIAWALLERDRHQPPVSGLDWTTLTPRADTSLRRALELEPDNEQYFRAVAHFLIASGVTYRLYGPYGVFNERLERARKSGDAGVIAKTALEAGRVYWLRYDQQVCEKLAFPGNNMLPWPVVEGGLPAEPSLTSSSGYAGEFDYIKSEFLFHEAYDAAPQLVSAFRRYATVLADQMRWGTLAAIARNQVRLAPTDGWAWLVLGLAAHKLGQTRTAAAAFDTALKRLEPTERTRLDRIERVLDARQAVALGALSDSARAFTEAFFWRNADPLWTAQGGKPRTEFLARVAFAELRWTQEEIGLNGVNTDPGNAYIRTGSRLHTGCKQTRAAWYVSDDTTVLRGPPASWSRLAGVRIDTIPAQVARFRAIADSSDVLVATLPPIAAIAKAAQVVGPVRTDFWILAGGLAERARDSVLRAKPGPQLFVHRLAPGGYVYRSEATADGSLLAARGSAGFIAGNDPHTGLSARGVGMSDVLLALRLEPHSASPARWTDFEISPAVGPVAANATISLLWENYEFGQENGIARYSVNIAIQRQSTPLTAADPVAASIVGGVGAGIKIIRTSDKVEFNFDRTIRYASTLVDNVTVSLGKSPPGNYLVTLRVTDGVTGSRVGRTQRLVVTGPQAIKPALYGR
jgi:tetratricopeptide (TPR) repeat protein